MQWHVESRTLKSPPDTFSKKYFAQQIDTEDLAAAQPLSLSLPYRFYSVRWSLFPYGVVADVLAEHCWRYVFYYLSK